MSTQRVIRIAIVDDVDDPDLVAAGSRQVIRTLVEGLDPARFQVVVILRGLGRFAELLRAARAGTELVDNPTPCFGSMYRYQGASVVPLPHVFALNLARLPVVIAGYTRLFRQLRIDVAYLANPIGHVSAGTGAWLTGIPAVWHLQGPPQQRQRVKLLLPVYRAWRGVTGGRVVAISRQVAERYGGEPSGRPQVILNGVDTSRFTPGSPDPARFDALGLQPGRHPIVGLVGYISRYKRMDLLPRVVAGVLHRCPEARFLVCGDAVDGPTVTGSGHDGEFPRAPVARKEMVRTIYRSLREAGHADRVVFAGPRDDLPELYRGMDVLAHLSAVEGFGLVLAEAMSAGRPVVAFRSAAGPRELVDDGVTGYLVPDPDDLETFAERIAGLLNDPASRDRMGSAARRRVEERFSRKRFISEFSTLFEELAESSGA
jgi:glycosyltransferase involved in cell wall biosynthesis